MSALPAYDGFYINLDRSADRRARMEARLAAAGLSERYQRFPAREARDWGAPSPLKPGEIGCFRSHRDLLAAQMGTSRVLHVLEDDAVFANAFAQALPGLFATGALEHFDILFTDTIVLGAFGSIAEMKRRFDDAKTAERQGRAIPFSVIDLAKRELACMASYFVAPSRIRNVVDALSDHLERGPLLPVDLAMRQLVDEGALKAGCLFPFITSVEPASFTESVINGAVGISPPVIAMSMARYSFFLDADHAGVAQPLMQRAMERAGFGAPDAHADLLAAVYRYNLMEQTRSS